MEKVNFKYSIKNIPLPSERAYLLQLMEKIEMFITRMRWKAIYCNNKTNDNSSERYGMQSKKTLTFADKTSNMYRLSKEEHEELLTNAAT